MHILGDFNINYFDLSYKNHLLTKAMHRMKLSQMVNSATRPISGTCLDHYHTTHPEFTVPISVLDIGLSDHLLIIIQRKHIRMQKNLMNNCIIPSHITTLKI